MSTAPKWSDHTAVIPVPTSRPLGVRLGSSDHPSGPLSGSYHFNLQELKAPVIGAVIESGWTWQPVMWNAPSALRPLTE